MRRCGNLGAVTLTSRTLCILAATGAMVLAACGSSSSESSATTAESSTSTNTTQDSSTTTMAPTTTASPTTTAPAIETTATTATTAPPPPEPAVTYCIGAGPVDGAAVMVSSQLLDLAGDGVADDAVEAYELGGVTSLRVTTGTGVVSELVNPRIDGTTRPLGVADVFAGDSLELFSVVGEGDAASEIAMYGLDATGCLFVYRWADDGTDFTMLIRPGSDVRSGGGCFEGGVYLTNGGRDTDGTWFLASAAYEVVTPGTVEYMGASDDYNEGVAEADLGPFDFDCFGLAL
jgi:hypothetical protein